MNCLPTASPSLWVPFLSATRAAALAGALLAYPVLLVHQASAASWTWSGGVGTYNSNSPGNWVGRVVPTWGADDDLFFRTVTTSSFTTALMSNRKVRSLTFGTNSTNDFYVSLSNHTGITAYDLTM